MDCSRSFCFRRSDRKQLLSAARQLATRIQLQRAGGSAYDNRMVHRPSLHYYYLLPMTTEVKTSSTLRSRYEPRVEPRRGTAPNTGTRLRRPICAGTHTSSTPLNTHVDTGCAVANPAADVLSDSVTPSSLVNQLATTRPAGPVPVLVARGRKPSSSTGIPNSVSLDSYARITSLCAFVTRASSYCA